MLLYLSDDGDASFSMLDANGNQRSKSPSEDVAMEEDGITSSAADYDQSESVLTTEDTDADNMWQYRTVKQPTTALDEDVPVPPYQDQVEGRVSESSDVEDMGDALPIADMVDDQVYNIHVSPSAPLANIDCPETIAAPLAGIVCPETIAEEQPMINGHLESVDESIFSSHSRQPDTNFIPVRRDDPRMAVPGSLRSSTPTSMTRRPMTSGRRAPSYPMYYVDMAYVPHHCNKNHSTNEFFKRIRSRYYVVSGENEEHDEPSDEVLQSLLLGKKSWRDDLRKDLNVTLVSTHNSSVLTQWAEKHKEELAENSVHVTTFDSEDEEPIKIDFST